MAANKLLNGAQKLLEPNGDVKTSQVLATASPQPTAAVASKVDPAAATTVQVAAARPQVTSPQVVVVAKVSTSGVVSANSQLQVTKPAVSQVASIHQATTSGRTVVITVPRPAAPQPVTVAPRPPQSSPLPANIQIPSGMMLVRSDSGQLMLVSQQALAQVQQAPRITSSPAPRIVSSQVPTATGPKGNEKVTVIRMTAPPTFLPAPMQKTTVVKVVGVAPKPAVTQSVVSAQESQPRIQAPIPETKKEPSATFTPETLESVKKCKNFLVTLIKLASSDSRSANMANNVRGLVRSLLEGKLEAEEFTEQLYQELKSTPQPCLVPFLKKSLPAVRCLTADPQLFIQKASTSACSSSSQSTSNEPEPDIKRPVAQPATKVVRKPGFNSIINSKISLTKDSRLSIKPTGTQPKQLTGVFSVKQTFHRDVTCSSRPAVKSSSGSYKEDDDINDVAFMAGVNLREENAQFLTTTVGSVLQSCQDQPFLSTNTLLGRILGTGRPLGVTDVSAEVVALVSHATQEFLRGLLEKVTVIAEHRKAVMKEDQSYSKVSDVRSQLRFLEEVEALNKKKRDEAEREKLLRLARSRSHPEDPQFQLLKQKAKELQQIEEAQLQQREANITALAAIGPRRKRPVELSEGQVCVLPRQEVPRVTRVVLRDLLACMEQENFLRHSLTLYKAML